jgi:hypothetical protein
MSPLWKVYYFEVFYLQYTKLIADVFEQKKKDPEGYKFHESERIIGMRILPRKNKIISQS